MEVRRADVLAQSMYQREEKIENLDQIEELYRQIVEDGDCVSLKDLAVTGRDQIASGMKPGKGNWRETGGIAETGHRGSQIKYKGRTAETAELKKIPCP